MSYYQLEPSPPSRDPTRSLIVGIILVLLFLVVMAALFLLSRSELVMASTPTPTATFAFVATATPDFGATRVAEDLAAQHTGPTAFEVGEARTATDANAIDVSMAASDTPPEVIQVQPVSPSPVALSDTPSPVAISPLVSPLDTPSVSNEISTTINLPLAVGAAPPTIMPTSSPTSSPTSTATPTLPAPTDTATSVPTDTATPVPITPSPTIPPTPSPTPYTIDRLLAEVEDAEINRQLAPLSGFDTESDQTWNLDNEIVLSGRSTSGEWVYGEQNDEFGWLRQVHIEFLDNELPGDAPEGLNPNDVRWLPFRPWPSDVEPLPVPTSMPTADYPLALRNRANQNWVEALPPSTLVSMRPNSHYEAGSSFSSPVAVAGDLVAVANADRHIYAVSREYGNQKWKRALDNNVSQPLAIQDATVYAIDEIGIVYAVNESERQWATATAMEPTAGVSIAGDSVIVVGRAGEDKRLVLLKRDDGEIIDTFTQTGADFLLPAVGDQLIYVVGSRVWALDLHHAIDEDDPVAWHEIWSYTAEDSSPFTSPPVYSSPGPTALAELYVGAADGRIYLLDANTGKRLEWYNGDLEATRLAINDSRLHAVGPSDEDDGLLRVYDRAFRDSLWSEDLASPVVSGPIVDGENVLLFLEDGTILMFDGNGGSKASTFIPSTLRGGAVSGQALFAAGSDNKIYALKGSN